MKIYKETSLSDFEFWSGAIDRAKYFTEEEFNTIEDILVSEDCEEKGFDETEINDLFWFEEDTLAEWLGYESFEEMIKDREEK